MAFQAPKLTNAGKALYYDNMAGAQITITTIKMGSGTLAGPIANLTDLVEPVVVVDALATVRDNYVDVSGTFSNADLDQGFYWREIGVFAANPDDPENREADILYCYQNAYDTADYIPVASVETVEKNIVVPIIVGDAAAVSCTLDHSLVLATLKDLEDHENDKNAHPGLTHYDPIGSAEKAVLEHDKDDTSHEDIRTALSNKVSHFGNVTKFDTVLAAASALTVDGTFFGDPSSSIYNAEDKPPNTTAVQYFVMLDGTTGRRVVLAVGYAATDEYRYFGTRDILNGAWLNEWRELVDTQYLKENYNWLWLSDDVLTESAAPTEYPMGTSIFFSNATWNGLVSATVYTERKTNAQIMQRIYMWSNPNVYYRIGDMQGNWMAWNRIATITSEPSTAGARAISAGTTDLTAGSSALATGQIYLVYG